MIALSIKSELKSLIEQAEDMQLPQTVKTLLQEPRSSSILQAKLTARALSSENDIQADRVFTREEITEHIATAR